MVNHPLNASGPSVRDRLHHRTDHGARQIAAAGLMVLGYAIIAVPTGIVSVELVQAAGHQPVSTQACPAGSAEGHDVDAVCCQYCGERLYPATV